jgi:flavin reductase (DIM6/NTAB) family NADH-FMN oxidoreductase RutF
MAIESDQQLSEVPALDGQQFRTLMACFATGVAVVSALDHTGAPQGATVSSFCSVSLDPPLVLVCLSRNSRTLEAMRLHQLMGISFLSRDQAWIARLFALDVGSKFRRVAYRNGRFGTPLLSEALGHAECEVIRCLDLGDHTAVVGLVVAGTVHEHAPLLHFRRQYGDFEASEQTSIEAWTML